MAGKEPVAELDARFSSEGATPTMWAEAGGRLEDAEVYWPSTVRPDGRPRVTTLLSLWLDGALYFCTGATERKAKNLVRNPHCILTTGCNALDEGLDLVVEANAVKVSDDAKPRRIADAYESGTAVSGTSMSATAPSSVTVARPWCTRSLPRRSSVSARASAARPDGASSEPDSFPGFADFPRCLVTPITSVSDGPLHGALRQHRRRPRRY